MLFARATSRSLLARRINVLPQFRQTRINSYCTTNVDHLEGREFDQIGILKHRSANLAKLGIKKMFPIQEETYDLIKSGASVVGRAKTGTGKTLAFTLPLLERYLGADSAGGESRSPVIVVVGE